MDFITGLFSMDFTALVPNLNTMLGLIRFLLSLLLLAAPLSLLILGFMCRFMAPPEANYTFGFRTYFGMGSVMAWRFTQFVSGILMTLAGIILTFVAFSTVKTFDGMDSMEMTEAAFRCIKGQIICALIIYIFMILFTAVLFNRKGNPRFNMPFLEKFKEKPRKRKQKNAKPVS